MRNSLKKLKRLFITLKDFGLRRIIRRIIYELKIYAYKLIPSKLIKFFLNRNSITPNWEKILNELEINDIVLTFNKLKKYDNLKFKFLNDEEILQFPFKWNNKKWSRLWQFNLHYFDWARIWLEEIIRSKSIPDEAIFLENLIDYWITENPVGKGDGWHSYTLSLRIRNWIWIFRTFPRLVNNKRLKSLWDQLCWLEINPEDANGGNHWIENLITLSIGSLQFSGFAASKMHFRAIRLLKNELEIQLLKDGGHEERSASYHLLILSRLIELALIFSIVKKERPIWLIRDIEKMITWTEKIKLNKNNFPRFNDSSKDSCPSISKVLFYYYCFREGKTNETEILRNYLANKDLSEKEINFVNINICNKVIEELPYTGWYIIRLEKDWEFLFKYGYSGPKHLHAHAHSDALSFDIFHEEIPYIAEVGTSIYGNNEERFFERSGEAHNILQLGIINKNKSNNKIDWIESIDIYGNFKAGKKSNPVNNSSFIDKKGLITVSGEYDYLKKYNATHKRQIKLFVTNNNDLELIINDEVFTKKVMAWRQIWHLGSNIKEELFSSMIRKLKSDFQCEVNWKNTWYSVDFGKRIYRKSLFINGFTTNRKINIISKVKLPNKFDA